MTKNNHALIIVDMQNDFLPGGAVAVPNGNQIIGKINQLIEKFDHIILTQDWHPKGHCSFASSHGHNSQKPQGETLWPDHCIQGTKGAQITQELRVEKAQLILRKGYRPNMDSYSAFFENDKITATGLQGYCQECGFTKLSFCGLATDFCVGNSALDALKCGFETRLYLDACRPIDNDNLLPKMLKDLKTKGAELILGA